MFVGPVTVVVLPALPIEVFDAPAVLMFVVPAIVFVEVPLVPMLFVVAPTPKLFVVAVEPNVFVVAEVPNALVAAPEPMVFVVVPPPLPMLLVVLAALPNVFVVPAFVPTVELPEDVKAPPTFNAGAFVLLVLLTVKVVVPALEPVKSEPVPLVPLVLIVPVAWIDVAPLVMLRPVPVELIVSPVSGALVPPIARPVPAPAVAILRVAPVVPATTCKPVVGLTGVTGGTPIAPLLPIEIPVVVAEIAMPVGNGSITTPVPAPAPVTWMPPAAVAEALTCSPNEPFGMLLIVITGVPAAVGEVPPLKVMVPPVV